MPNRRAEIAMSRSEVAAYLDRGPLLHPDRVVSWDRGTLNGGGG